MTDPGVRLPAVAREGPLGAAPCSAVYTRLRTTGWRWLRLPSLEEPRGPGRHVPPDLVREALAKGGRFRMVALGLSMSPAITHGEELVFEPVVSPRVRMGDVVLVHYRDQSRYCVHRVVGRFGLSLLTKGDSLDTMDHPVAPQDLLGRLRYVGTGSSAVDLATLGHRLAARVVARLSLLSLVVAAGMGQGNPLPLCARFLRLPSFALAFVLYRLGRTRPTEGPQ